MVAAKFLRVLSFCTVIGLGSCSSISPKSGDPLQAGPIKQTPEAIQAAPQLSAAQQSIKSKDWPAALAELQSIIDISTFGSLPVDLQYQALSLASRVAIYHGPKERGYAYLQRVIAMPQAESTGTRSFASQSLRPIFLSKPKR